MNRIRGRTGANERHIIMEGRLLVDVVAARGLRDTQIFGTQDPYVVYTLLPDDGTTARSKHVPSGGTAPAFSPHHGALVSLPLTRSHAVLRVEVWNSNTFADDRIGGVDLELYKPYWEYGAGAQFEAALDTGGTLQMVLHNCSGADGALRDLRRLLTHTV